MQLPPSCQQLQTLHIPPCRPAASASQAGQRLMALNCHTLELQLWSALPGFCSWLQDGPTAYPACVQVGHRLYHCCSCSSCWLSLPSPCVGEFAASRRST